MKLSKRSPCSATNERPPYCQRKDSVVSTPMSLATRWDRWRSWLPSTQMISASRRAGSAAGCARAGARCRRRDGGSSSRGRCRRAGSAARSAMLQHRQQVARPGRRQAEVQVRDDQRVDVAGTAGVTGTCGGPGGLRYRHSPILPSRGYRAGRRTAVLPGDAREACVTGRIGDNGGRASVTVAWPAAPRRAHRHHDGRRPAPWPLAP